MYAKFYYDEKDEMRFYRATVKVTEQQTGEQKEVDLPTEQLGSLKTASLVSPDGIYIADSDALQLCIRLDDQDGGGTDNEALWLAPEGFHFEE